MNAHKLIFLYLFIWGTIKLFYFQNAPNTDREADPLMMNQWDTTETAADVCHNSNLKMLLTNELNKEAGVFFI